MHAFSWCGLLFGVLLWWVGPLLLTAALRCLVFWLVARRLPPPAPLSPWPEFLAFSGRSRSRRAAARALAFLARVSPF
jgi:hypothetical protein